MNTLPTISSMNCVSWKCRVSNHGPVELRRSSELDTVQHAMAHSSKQTKPEMRTPQPKPQVMNSRCSMMGYTTPPADSVSRVIASHASPSTYRRPTRRWQCPAQSRGTA